VIKEGQAWCSGESCLTESPGRGFEAASPQICGGKACLGFSLPQTPHVGASGTGSAIFFSLATLGLLGLPSYRGYIRLNQIFDGQWLSCICVWYLKNYRYLYLISEENCRYSKNVF